MIKNLPICHTEMELVDKINEIIAELNIFIQEREHYCKVYEEVVKPAMLPEKKKKEETRPIPAYINGIGECIVYTTCDKCVDKFQIFKTLYQLLKTTTKIGTEKAILLKKLVLKYQ